MSKPFVRVLPRETNEEISSSYYYCAYFSLVLQLRHSYQTYRNRTRERRLAEPPPFRIHLHYDDTVTRCSPPPPPPSTWNVTGTKPYTFCLCCTPIEYFEYLLPTCSLPENARTFLQVWFTPISYILVNIFP